MGDEADPSTGAGASGPRPSEPSVARWHFPDPAHAGDQDVLGLGADLEPATLLQAYRRGIFPMPLTSGGPMAWWSPDPRAILELHELRVSRSLRKSMRRYQLRIDTSFDEVVSACGDPTRPNGWIDERIATAYLRMHQLGWAHSIEAWDERGLAGGLYGVAIGGLFAGESMFHRRTDASKVALVHLVELLSSRSGADCLLDVQFLTPHLERLGAREIPRRDYLARLQTAQLLPQIEWRCAPNSSTEPDRRTDR